MLNCVALDLIFRALSHPTRRWVFELLCAYEDLSVTALLEPLPVSLPALMQHLDILERAGLARSSKEGPVRFWSIERQGLARLDQWMREQRSQFERRQPGGSALDRRLRWPVDPLT